MELLQKFDFIHSVILWVVMSLVLTTLLFFVAGKVKSANKEVVQNLYHISLFQTTHSQMIALKENNLYVSLPTLQKSYGYFYAYTHGGEGLSQKEIERIIQTEADYLKLVNPTFLDGSLPDYVLDLFKEEGKLERIQLALFISLLITQVLPVLFKK